MIFISCSFDPFSKPYGQLAQELFDEYGIDAYIAEHPEPGSLPDILRAKLKQSEALVALVTTQDSPWQQTEITWASEFNIPIYGIVQTGENVVYPPCPTLTKSWSSARGPSSSGREAVILKEPAAGG